MGVKQTGVEYHQTSAGLESELRAKPRPSAEGTSTGRAPRTTTGQLHLLCAEPIIVVIYSPRSSTFHYLLRVSAERCTGLIAFINYKIMGSCK